MHRPYKSQGGIYAVIKIQGMLGHTTHADENPLHFKSKSTDMDGMSEIWLDIIWMKEKWNNIFLHIKSHIIIHPHFLNYQNTFSSQPLLTDKVSHYIESLQEERT